VQELTRTERGPGERVISMRKHVRPTLLLAALKRALSTPAKHKPAAKAAYKAGRPVYDLIYSRGRECAKRQGRQQLTRFSVAVPTVGRGMSSYSMRV
jgi:hypothetical protein